MPEDTRPVYLDYAATTPVDPRVAKLVMHYMTVEFGNAGSRTHVYGSQALKAVNDARKYVAAVADAAASDLIFTSGATETINMAILGLTDHGLESGKKHIVSTMIEHKATLECLVEMERHGFEVTLIRPGQDGRVDAKEVFDAVRDDTLLLSVMHVNNETGAIQPIDEIATLLEAHDVLFHTDAAQGVGKEQLMLKNKRIDMISMSGHKIGAPMGIGALILRRRKYKLPPIKPLLYGGGQERGLRGGTLPVHLIVGMGEATRLAVKEFDQRKSAAVAFRNELLAAFEGLSPDINGSEGHCVASTINLSFGNLDSEAVMLALKPYVAISNGSACTSAAYLPSHVLTAMGLPESRVRAATRWSWGSVVEWGCASELRKSLLNIRCE